MEFLRSSLLLFVLLFIQVVFSEDVTSIRCNKTDWQEGSIAYVGTSLVHVNYPEIPEEYSTFTDSTITDDYGVLCDPAAYFYHPNKSRVRFLSRKDQFSWNDVSPGTTMLNITCHNNELVDEIRDKNIATYFPHLESLSLRCKLGNIEPKNIGRGNKIFVLDLSNNELTTLDKDLLQNHTYLVVLI